MLSLAVALPMSREVPALLLKALEAALASTRVARGSAEVMGR